jgi:hypothetical protein
MPTDPPSSDSWHSFIHSMLPSESPPKSGLRTNARTGPLTLSSNRQRMNPSLLQAPLPPSAPLSSPIPRMNWQTKSLFPTFTLAVGVQAMNTFAVHVHFALSCDREAFSGFNFWFCTHGTYLITPFSFIHSFIHHVVTSTYLYPYSIFLFFII